MLIKYSFKMFATFFSIFNDVIVFNQYYVRLISICFIGNKWLDCFSEVFVAHYPILTFVYKTLFDSFPSEFYT